MAAISSHRLTSTLEKATQEELLHLTRLFKPDAPQPLTQHDLYERILKVGGNGIMNSLTGGLSYAHLLSDVCGILEVDGFNTYYSRHPKFGFSPCEADAAVSAVGKQLDLAYRNRLIEAYVHALESRILTKLMINFYEALTPEQRKQVDEQLRPLSASHGLAGAGAAAALLTIGNMGGFATYTLMSTVLSTATAGALSFGAYTFASSFLSLVLGPPGWIALGTYAAAKIGAPNKSKAVHVAATCAAISQRIQSDSASR